MPKSKRKKRSYSKSGFFGAYKNTTGNKYTASIKISGKYKYLGSSYDTAKQAAKAYDKEAIKLRRPVSSLNFPKKVPVGYTPIQQVLLSTNTVGYRGETKRGKKFQARIEFGGKRTSLGTYETAKDAAIAYDRAVLKANKSTSLLNFPDMVHDLDVEPKRKKYKRSSSGYRGVKEEKRNGTFTARRKSNGILESLGTYETAKDAAIAYDRAVLKPTNGM